MAVTKAAPKKATAKKTDAPARERKPIEPPKFELIAVDEEIARNEDDVPVFMVKQASRGLSERFQLVFDNLITIQDDAGSWYEVAQFKTAKGAESFLARLTAAHEAGKPVIPMTHAYDIEPARKPNPDGGGRAVSVLLARCGE